MGLASVMQTALGGLAAAETSVAVVAHNLANARTAGYKASRPVLVTQAPQTQSPGASPSGASGGANPVQVGLGVTVAAVVPDFSQGQIATDSRPLDLAIEGEGMFILRGPGGERSYTRDGRFALNADREVVTAAGDRVLGHAADENLHLQTGRLGPLRIPLGKVIAKPGGGAATLTGFSIDRDGRIQGRFSDGRLRTLGQIRMARFANPSGLGQHAGNRSTITPNSGEPVESNPQEAGAGSVLAGATELSNTDLAQGLIDLSVASMMSRANFQVLQAGSHLLDELLGLQRK